MKKVFVLMAIAAMTLVACKPNNPDDPNNPDKPDQPTYEQPITIDGSFDDWAKLDASKVASAKNVDGASHEALKLVKVYADEVYIFVYFEWDTDETEWVPGEDHVPFHMYLNSDGDSATGGFSDQWSDACSDVLLEGSLYDENGMASYDPGAYKWIGEANGSGWGWEPDGENILASGQGLCSGAGVPGKYEIALLREMWPLGSIADNFSIGFDIQKNWDTVGLLPNGEVTEDNPSGTVPSLKVTTVK